MMTISKMVTASKAPALRHKTDHTIPSICKVGNQNIGNNNCAHIMVSNAICFAVYIQNFHKRPILDKVHLSYFLYQIRHPPLPGEKKSVSRICNLSDNDLHDLAIG